MEFQMKNFLQQLSFCLVAMLLAPLSYAQTGPLPTGHTLSLQSDFNEHSLTATFKSRDGIELTNLGDATVRGTSSFYEISCVLSGGTVDLRNTELHFTNKANQRQGVDNR